MSRAISRFVWPLVAAAVILGTSGAAARQGTGSGGMIVSGTIGNAETDLSPDQEQHLLGEYWSITKKYLAADPMLAVKEIAAWTLDRVGKVQSIQYQPERALPSNLETKAEWSPRLLRAAAMMHTDVALVALKQRSMMALEYHLGLADGWFALADNRKSEPGALRSRWNVAIARLLLLNGELAIAERGLVRIDQRIPNDPGIMLVYGTAKEAQAMRTSLPVSSGKVDDPGAVTTARDSSLNAAQSLLQRALAADPKLTEAKLRLAHVLILRHEDAKAEPMLAEVLSSQPAPPLKFLADLLMGGIRERQGQFDPAARLYVDAILAVPDGQSAYLAFAHVMHHAGQTNDAATVLDRLFNRGILNAASDPWWIYPLGLDAAVESHLNDLRAEIRK
jgi:tetratricopeptide (TPR) repeat protein